MTIMEKNKIIVSLQIHNDLYEMLKKKAEEECTSTSYLIRKAILKEVRSWGEEK